MLHLNRADFRRFEYSLLLIPNCNGIEENRHGNSFIHMLLYELNFGDVANASSKPIALPRHAASLL